MQSSVYSGSRSFSRAPWCSPPAKAPRAPLKMMAQTTSGITGRRLHPRAAPATASVSSTDTTIDRHQRTAGTAIRRTAFRDIRSTIRRLVRWRARTIYFELDSSEVPESERDHHRNARALSFGAFRRIDHRRGARRRARFARVQHRIGRTACGCGSPAHDVARRDQSADSCRSAMARNVPRLIGHDESAVATQSPGRDHLPGSRE